MSRHRLGAVLLLAGLVAVTTGGVVRADTTRFAEFRVPDTGPLRDVAVGFGWVWIIDSQTPTGFPKISKLSPDAGQALTSFTGLTKTSVGGIITGMDAAWHNLASDENRNPGETIGRLDATTGVITEFALPTDAGSIPRAGQSPNTRFRPPAATRWESSPDHSIRCGSPSGSVSAGN